MSNLQVSVELIDPIEVDLTKQIDGLIIKTTSKVRFYSIDERTHFPFCMVCYAQDYYISDMHIGTHLSIVGEGIKRENERIENMIKDKLSRGVRLSKLEEVLGALCCPWIDYDFMYTNKRALE